MTAHDETVAPSARGAFIQADQPWNDAILAHLYDLFPFDADLQLYCELGAAQNGRILEVACGSGRVLVPLAQAGYAVVGVDASPYMLDLARQKLAAAGTAVAGRARLMQGDMRSFSLDERFDLAIIAAKSFAYLLTRAEQLAALATVAAHLRPGGLLVLDFLNPAPGWLLEPPGSLRQDLVQYVPEQGVTVARTEAVVSTDLAAQIRVIRSAYEIVAADGSVTKRFVEWPYRYTYRFEAEHLLERAGFEIQAVYGGYRYELFTSESKSAVFLARLPNSE
jgi:SAM-dependent methyltransferase